MDVPDGFVPYGPQGPFLEHIGPIHVREAEGGLLGRCRSPTSR